MPPDAAGTASSVRLDRFHANLQAGVDSAAHREVFGLAAAAITYGVGYALRVSVA